MKPGFLLAFLFCLLVEHGYSQCDPNPLFNSPARNYVMEKQVNRQGVKDICTLMNLTTAEAPTQIQYFDGLGRPIQTVQKQASPSSRDIVQPFEYDGGGREAKKYLPYASGTMDGTFKPNAITQQAAFFNNNAAGNYDRIANDAYPFSKVVFDDSPLNQEVKVYGPGQAWQTGSTDRSIRTLRRTNTASEVRRWKMDATGSASIVGYYPEKKLLVTEITDEDGNKTFTYTDLEGKTLLRRVQLNATENAETYYVYNEMGQLRYVVPPGNTSTSIGFGSTDNKNLYAYRYDARGRVTEKKVPGGGVTCYIYDRNDRLVMSQTENQRTSNQWSFTRYDSRNRPVITGLYTHTAAASQAAMQNLYTGNNRTVSEKRQGSTPHGYSILVWPFSNTEILTVSYYDDYDFDYNGTRDFSYQAQGLSGEGSADYYVNSLPTGTKTRILGTDDWLRTAIYYDSEKRVIQIRKNNQLNLTGWPDTETIVYDFSGKPLIRKKIHDVGNGPLSVTEEYGYDHAGRLLQVYHKTGTAPKILLSTLVYNEAGQVTEKNLDVRTTTLQSLDYEYNIRGALTGLNNVNNLADAYASNEGTVNNDNDDLFAFNLYYHDQNTAIYNSPLYNGNITAMRWASSRTASTRNYRAYRYTYDKAGRLTFALYGRQGTSGFDVIAGLSERISYLKNGNIDKLIRLSSASDTIDKLEYFYNGMQLKAIQDSKDKVKGFTDYAASAEEYIYDGSGNLLNDDNKLQNYRYNHLNLVEYVNGENGIVMYTHDATGRLVYKNVMSDGNLISTYYLGGAEYRQIKNLVTNATGPLTLKFISHPEGRVKQEGTGYRYEYDIRDHLGNVRITFDRGPSNVARITQEDHYYPFGMRLDGLSYDNSTGNKYLFNGKEFQQESGLYDYGARMYDPTIGRFSTVDPLGELITDNTPYNYVFNNPVNFTDPFGLYPEKIDNSVIDKTNFYSLGGGGGGDGKYVPSPQREFNGFTGSSNSYNNNSNLDRAYIDMYMSGVQNKATANQSNNVQVPYLPNKTSSSSSPDNYTSKQASAFLGLLGFGIDLAGGAYGAMEGASASQGQWLGKNGKYYPMSWGGNQYTGGRSGALGAAKTYRLAGSATTFLALGVGVYSTILGYKLDGNQFGYNAQKAASRSAGSIIGGIAGAKFGSWFGAGLGMWFGGFGAVPGYIIGGVVGGFTFGYWGGDIGGNLGEKAVNYYHSR